MHSKLIDTLDTDGRRALENVRAAAARIWARPLHRTYTDHTPAHSERVIGLLDGLAAGARLSPAEALILLTAAYLHDIGMQNEKFAGGDVEKIRAEHNEVTAEMIYAVFEDPANAFPIPLARDPAFVEAVALVAKGHRRVDLNGLEYEPFVHGEETLRLRLLAALLRFADELDIDHRRVDIEAMKLLDLPVESQLHWWRCHYVGGVGLVDGYIRVSYRFPQDRPDYETLIVPLVETEIRAKLADLEEIFWADGVKVALGRPQVRLMRLVKPLPTEVEALAREWLEEGNMTGSQPPSRGRRAGETGHVPAPDDEDGEQEGVEPATPAASRPSTTVFDQRGQQVGQQFNIAGDFVVRGPSPGAPAQTGRRDWEAWIAQVTARLDALSAQLGQGVADLKRGQAALYRGVGAAHRDDLARVLAAVQEGRLEQGEMRATLDALRRAMRVVVQRGLPMDDELRAAVADLTEAVESRLSVERKLELALPLLPLLTYKIELGVGSDVDLHALWDDIRARWKRLVERFGG
jgi:hypothetical protein